jgi:hypothetical protein
MRFFLSPPTCCSKAAATDALLFFLSPPKNSLSPSDPLHRRVVATSDLRYADGPYSDNPFLALDVICSYFDFDSHA